MSHRRSCSRRRTALDSIEMSDPTICFCHNVTREALRAAIRAGAKSLIEIQETTSASTGCGGCEWDVREILDEALKEENPEKEG